ncbi:SOS response-associated peptidase [Fodinibius sediminis]|uniref:Abasic site processing protein n=1 Tax=Fodinibius sediminis TaxID=1214077 RepID=A0A521DL65_9BACT|nr:SOS response-associated peptidase [Fodinibius sediminis]SMO72474.1 Putative SOS response-associated peptidase YedK [Fodinibius sediminis]
MCTFFDSHIHPDKLGYLFGAKLNIPKNFEGRRNTRPTNPSFIIKTGEDGEREVTIHEFGLIPSWSKDRKLQYSTMNARDDKLMSSNLWRPLFKSKRCIVPVAGFYEHHHLDKEVSIPGGKKPTDKIPYYFTLSSQQAFGLAGLYDHWVDKESGQTIGSFSIITTDPNPVVRKIHNSKERMPTILRKEDYDFWLDKTLNPEDYFDQNIFVPYPEDDMEVWQVSKGLDYGQNDEELIKPVDHPIDLDEIPGTQKGLFGD